MDEKAPFSKIAKKYDNKKAPFQINFFSNFIRDNQKRSINFKSFFYFLNRKIANIIFFRLRVTYSRNLRNLQQEANAESIPCECTIIDEDLVDKEKLNIVSSPKTYILVDHTKFVDKLGEKCPVPIEVFPTAMNFVSSRLEQIGAVDIEFRGMTENGNSILDTRFDDISDDLERRIKIIPGVIESGLFVGYNTEVIGLD